MAHDIRAPRFSPQSFARDPRGFGISMRLARTRFRQGATARRPREHDFAGDRWHGFRDRHDICHSRHTEGDIPMTAGVPWDRFPAAAPTEAGFHAVLNHDRDSANRAMQLIAGRHHFRVEATLIRRSGTGPARSKAGRVPSLPTFAIDPHRQPAIPDGGRSPEKHASGDSPF